VTLAARLAGKAAAETISVMLAVFARIEPALRKQVFASKLFSTKHVAARTSLDFKPVKELMEFVLAATGQRR
jgi:hypothetical protein